MPADDLPGRRLGEIDADDRLVFLGLAVGVVMNLEDQVAPLAEELAHAVGQEPRHGAGCPAAEAAGRQNARARRSSA